MKNVHHLVSRASLGFAGRAACLAAILSLPVAAQGPNDGPATVSSGGDETVGTLPIIRRQDIKLPIVDGWRGNRPAFYLQGATSDIQATLLSARGTGFITVEALDPSMSTIRVAFHGHVSVAFDREMLETLPIQTGMAVPSAFAPRSVILNPGTQASRALRLRPGLLPLAVGELSSSHALDGSPLEIRSFGDSGPASVARVYSARGLLILRQSN